MFPWLRAATELWFNPAMTKTEAIRLLGGTVAAASVRIGVTPQALHKWPDELTAKLEDRVVAALAREYAPRLLQKAAAKASQ